MSHVPDHPKQEPEDELTENEPYPETRQNPVNTASRVHGRLHPTYVTVDSQPGERQMLTVGLTGNTKSLVSVVLDALSAYGVNPKKGTCTQIRFHGSNSSNGVAPWMMLPVAMALMEHRGFIRFDGLPPIFAFGALSQDGHVIPTGNPRQLMSLAGGAGCRIIIAPHGTPAIPGATVYTVRNLGEACNLFIRPTATAR